MSESASVLVAEVPISAHSIVLSHGTYCVFVTGVTQGLTERDLPALRISSSPGSSTVAVAALPGDGWLRQLGDAVLLRVASERSRVLFTSYDESRAPGAKPPQIQIQRLDDGRLPENLRPNPALPKADYTLHFSRKGDVPAGFGQWVGSLGDDSWIEGVELLAPAPLQPADLEYQVVLGRGWLSPWIAESHVTPDLLAEAGRCSVFKAAVRLRVAVHARAACVRLVTVTAPHSTHLHTFGHFLPVG
jgi:hypothetical protein